METRRKFLKDCMKGVISTMVFPSTFLKNGNPLRIGIIGAENSHTRGFGQMFNVNKIFPGVEANYVWGETEAFAKDAMERGGIPAMVKDPLEMLGKIDALIVDHRHGKYHLPAATPFVEAGIPTFVDKPFCYRLEEGKEFLSMAREKGTAVTSYSSIAHSYDTFDQIGQLKQYPEINQVVMYGPADIHSEYGGIFFYGPHLVEPMIYMFGLEVEKARLNANGKNSTANVVFQNGMMATLVFTTQHYGWQTYIDTDQGIIEIKSRAAKQTPTKSDADMVEMFRAGVEPRSHESILTGVAILEALERSFNSGQWEKIATI